MVVCICGKSFRTEAGIKQHIRRRYCRGPTIDNACTYCPAEERRPYQTYAGLRQHIRLAHPVEFNKDLEDQASNPIRDPSRWSDEELIAMAKEEIKFNGRFINRHLAPILNRCVEAVKARRRLPDYVALIKDLRMGPALVDIEEEVLDSDGSDLGVLGGVVEESLIGAIGGLTSVADRPVDRVCAGPSSSAFIRVDVADPGPSCLPCSAPGPLVPSSTMSLGRDLLDPDADDFVPTSRLDLTRDVLLDPDADDFVPSIASQLNHNDDPIFIHLQNLIFNNNIWDNYDKEIIKALSVRSINTELKELLLSNWLSALYKKLIKQIHNTEPRRTDNRPNNITNTRKKNLRALLYKKTQELYRKNRAELAECILDDKPPLSSVERPPLDELTKQFTDIFSADASVDNQPILDKKEATPGLYAPITSSEIIWALNSNKSNSAGPDCLRIKHLKQLDISKLDLLFNTMLFWGHIPAVLKENKTILIPKGGEPTCVDNWRPLTISSILLRLINKILGKRFSLLPIHHLQRGFRKIDGVILNNLTLDCLIKERRQLRKPYNILSVDLRKAFDSVAHASIKRAMDRFAVDDRLQTFILNGYSETYTTLQLGSYKSDRIHINRGVKQGDPLSPYLFNMIIDELIVKLQNTNLGLPLGESRIACMCYADDLLLFGSTIKDTQEILKITAKFLGSRGLEINHKKCNATSVSVVCLVKKSYIRLLKIFSMHKDHVFLRALSATYGNTSVRVFHH